MRRKDKEIHDPAEIEALLRGAFVCRIAFCDGDRPYLVPLVYAYHDRRIYFHSAREGRKIEILNRNNRVCVEVEADVRILSAEKACRFSCAFRSVIAFGRVYLVEDETEKAAALRKIMLQCSGREGVFDPQALARVAIYRVEIEEMTGKRSGFPVTQ